MPVRGSRTFRDFQEHNVRKWSCDTEEVGSQQGGQLGSARQAVLQTAGRELRVFGGPWGLEGNTVIIACFADPYVVLPRGLGKGTGGQ